MITCVIMGGLGNQLFQIYTTMALSIQMKTSFGFPASKMQTDKRNVTYWGNFLKELKKSASIADITRLQYPLYKEADFKYNKITISPDIMKNRGGVLLYGYYQSYKYFEKEYETICKYIKLEESKNDVRKLYDDKYFNSDKKIISMHFRLGDYKSLQYCHPILDVNYYINSLRFILKKEEGQEVKEGEEGDQSNKTNTNTNTSKKWLVLYFCEDEDILYVETKIKVIKEELIEYNNRIEFERATSHKENTQISDWKQLLLMSCCHHNIIANSSYSWWAAYFNNNPEKQVCYPEKWFGPQLAHNDTRDLCPPSWNKITF
jgi:hypothetical protein